MHIFKGASMDNGRYWQKRFAALEDMQYQKSREYIHDVEKQFRTAANRIQMDIERWYYRLADNNGISYYAAKKLLKADELEEFHWDVDTYIKYGKENGINQKWMKELENASAKVHINYLKAMKIQVQQEAEKLYQEFHGGITEFISSAYKDRFYKSAFEIAKGTGVGHSLARLDNARIEKVIKKPWAQDGMDFSSRIWKNKDRLVDALHTELVQCIIRGQESDEGAKMLAQKMDTGLSQARRLIYTECAAAASAAQKDCFKELGVEEFQVVATLDSHTSRICRDMDGKHFPMADYQPGVTAPPLHCNCRSTTCPYFDDEFTQGEKRAERGKDGKTHYVPADMTYKQWQQKFVGSGQKQFSKGQYGEQNYKPVLLDANDVKETSRGSVLISAKRATETTNNIYISDRVKLKPKQQHFIDMNLSKALHVLGVQDKANLPLVVIINNSEMQTGAMASYSIGQNILYLDNNVAVLNTLLELQKDCACPGNKLSTFVHELVHWQDAEMYHQKYGEITDTGKYLSWLRKKSKAVLDKLEKKGYDIDNISVYASEKYNEYQYDETYTEYRVKDKLEGG